MKAAKRVLLGLAALIVSAAVGAGAWLQSPLFGAHPEGDRLARLSASPHFVTAEGVFRNLEATPIVVGEQDGRITGFVKYLLDSPPRVRPDAALPAVKTDLRALPPGDDLVIWLGHSSYYVQLGGRRILIDPVLSDHAAPVSLSTRAFDGTTPYTLADLPSIDLLLITHDHWDHLDHATLTAIESRVAAVVTGLGVGAHLQRWGYPAGKLHERDWFGRVEPSPGLTVHVLPARHYSGRTLERNRTLWVGFALEHGGRRLLFSGDTGFGAHFTAIAKHLPGGFDLVALDMGQYDARWPLIHMTPEQAADAAEVLGAKALLPAHVGRFSIARHAWDEPFERIVAASTGRPLALATPIIGEPLRLDDSQRIRGPWWRGVERGAVVQASRSSE